MVVFKIKGNVVPRNIFVTKELLTQNRGLNESMRLTDKNPQLSQVAATNCALISISHKKSSKVSSV